MHMYKDKKAKSQHNQFHIRQRNAGHKAHKVPGDAYGTPGLRVVA